MSDRIFKCSACGRDDFKTQRGLTQHMQSRKACHPVVSSRNLFGLSDDGDKEGRKKRMRGMIEYTTILHANYNDDDAEIGANYSGDDEIVCAFSDDEVANEEASDCGTDSDDEELYENPNITGNDSDSGSDEDEEIVEDDESINSIDEDRVDCDDNEEVPIDDLLENFKEYEANSAYFETFEKKHRVAVELCRLLRKTKASLGTYDLMMQWHFWATGKLRAGQPVSTHPDYVSRGKLFKMLRRRYNYDQEKWTIVKEITLPFSRARARIVLNDAQAAMQSLLTDPRIRDEDYLFFDNDPFCPPPDDLDYIGDLNTGRSYKETYKALIKNPSKEVLLPIVLYADGAVTGQFSALSVTAVQFTLGIFTRVARDKEHMWRTLGYIPSYSKVVSRGKGFFKQTGHADAPMAYQNTYLENEGDVLEDVTQVPAQDLHAMLDVILKGFIELQNGGFYWDLQYNGILYKNVKFVPFVIFFKADTEEAEKLCGSYNTHTDKVSQLCRYCECPTRESDNHLADFRLKTKGRIQRLVDRGDEAKLKELSQQYIENALYKVRMGQHSDQHIHGSCPMEMLHAILLGIFGYVRDMFFEQCGPNSQLAEEMNSLATEAGMRLARQSERDMPKTKFAGGITRGKLQAKEHTGILLCILAVLCSTSGGKLLRDRKKNNFAEVGLLEDWIRLVETLLEWEEWLKLPIMERNHVQYRLKYKHQYLMYLIRIVGKRKAGMGLKLVKFHSILHMRHDILNFGVPMEYDTGSNESGHKKTKRAAKLTQKREETFDEQVDIRLQEEHLLEMAKEEMNGRELWNYRFGHEFPEEAIPVVEQPCLGGAKYQAYKDLNGNNRIRLLSRPNKKERPGKIESQLVEFLIGLNEKVSEYMGSVTLRTLHKRGGLKFRASPCFMKEIWRDWVMVNWGEHGEEACKIYGFVDLTQIPQNCSINYGGIPELGPGIYAIVENSYKYVGEDNDENHHLFIPIQKEVHEMRDNMVSKMQFYLADVEAFTSPLVVIPDMGGNANDYFLLRSRQEWSDRFIKYLEAPIREFPMEVID